MVLGSHNSWSYLTPKKWWMKFIRFTAKCQEFNIREQYVLFNVRCFDLRVRFDDDGFYLCHGIIEYKYSKEQIIEDLEYINSKKDCYVRVVLDIRTKRKLTDEQVNDFVWFCNNLTRMFKDIKFWCGIELVTGGTIFKFKYNPSCDEKYASVSPPKFIDDIFPKLYAKLNNKKNISKYTKSDILLIDFVDIQ